MRMRITGDHPCRKPRSPCRPSAKLSRKRLETRRISTSYARQDLSTVQKGEAVGVRYIIEVQDLEQTITETLDRIRERDGEKIFREAAEHVLADVAMLVEARARK